MPEPNCVCKTCSKPFYAKPSQIRLRNGGQYCSRACKYSNRDAFHRGPSHPGWAGDNVSAKAGRQRARRAYAMRECETCGAKHNLDRHHIDGDTSNNAPGNIAVLCRRCHMEEDGRLDRFAALNKRTTGDHYVPEREAAA